MSWSLGCFELCWLYTFSGFDEYWVGAVSIIRLEMSHQYLTLGAVCVIIPLPSESNNCIKSEHRQDTDNGFISFSFLLSPQEPGTRRNEPIWQAAGRAIHFTSMLQKHSTPDFDHAHAHAHAAQRLRLPTALSVSASPISEHENKVVPSSCGPTKDFLLVNSKGTPQMINGTF